MKRYLFEVRKKVGGIGGKLIKAACKEEPGIDGILVTVGLCIIALLLCVVMKDSLAVFIKTLVDAMTIKANEILTGVTA